MKKGRMKRFISLCMTIVLLLGMCTHLVGCGSKETTVDTQSDFQKDPNATYLTKGEWISALAKQAGITEAESTNAYFTDVSESDELFFYVQAAADRGWFESVEGAFEPNADASREFVIATAVLAADVLEDYGYLADADRADYETCIQFAYDNGNIDQTEESYLAEPVTTDEGQVVLEWLEFVYTNPVVNEKEEVVLQEGVIDFREETAAIAVVENTVTFTSDVAASLQAGDVFLIPPTDGYPVAIAKKAVSVVTDASGNVVVETETPELGEIFEELSIEQVVSLENAYFQLPEGVTFADTNTSASNSDNYQLISRGGGGGGGGHGGDDKGFHRDSNGDLLTKKIDNKEYTFEDKTFNVDWSTDRGVLIKSQALSETTGMDSVFTDIQNEKQREKMKEFLDGANCLLDGESIEDITVKKNVDYEENTLEINGSLTLKNFYAVVNMDLQHGVLRSSDVTLNYDADVDVAIKGEYRNEIPLIPVIIPVAGVCAVETTLYLYLDAEGNFNLGIYNGATATLSYKDGVGMNFRATERENQPPSIKVRLTAESGVGLSAGVAVVGVDVLKMGVDLGAQLEYKAEIRDQIDTDTEDDMLVQTDSVWLDFYGTLTYPVLTRYAEFDVVVAKGEGKSQLIGPEGTMRQETPAVLFDEKFLLMEEKFYFDMDGNELFASSDTFTTKLEEFVNAPTKGQCTYDNFYEKAGVQNFVSNLKFLENPDDLTQMQQYIAGTDFSYTEEDLVFGDGSTLSGGAQLSFHTQEEDRWDEDYSIIWYEEDGLQRIRTDRVHTDTRDKGIVGNVGGFSDFLGDNRCATIMDCVEVFGLNEAFVDAAAQTEADYYETINAGKYGMVEVYIETYADFTSEIKSLIFVFAEDSVCPYREIIISERLANTLTAEIPILRVEAYTPLYYD